MLLTRNLLYTGMTRAKKLLIVIGSKNIIDFMINNSDNKKRNTGLAFKLRKQGQTLFAQNAILSIDIIGFEALSKWGQTTFAQKGGIIANFRKNF